MRASQIILFLTHLLRHIRGELLVIGDALRGHRSGAVRDFVAAQHGRLTLEFLPGYAPDLNPVEHIWGHLKRHEIPNLCPKNLWELSTAARRGAAAHAASPDAGVRVLEAGRVV